MFFSTFDSIYGTFPPPFKYFSESPEKELTNVRNYLPDIIESVPFLIISE